MCLCAFAPFSHIIFPYHGLLRQHDLHSDEETPVALRADGVAGLAVGRVAVGEDVAGVKNIIHGQIHYGKIPLDGHDLTGRKTQVVNRRRAVGEEGLHYWD